MENLNPRRSRFEAQALHELLEIDRLGQRGFMSDLVEDFAITLRKFIADIRSASNEARYKDLSRHAHTLKSSSLALGLLATSDICLQMETDARSGLFKEELFSDLQVESSLALKELIEFNLKRMEKAG
jgi:HPt (histidine-containing phosphotransfer) domain-containing protein